MWKTLVQKALEAFKKPGYRAALAVALVSDALSYGFALLPFMQWMVDIVTALALWALLGFKWPLMPALAVEVVPGIELYPAWTLAVASYAALDGGP